MGHIWFRGFLLFGQLLIAAAQAVVVPGPTPAGSTRMTGQPPPSRVPNLAGTWRRITIATCANKYPETISFAESTYLGTRGKDQPFVWWDAGIYRLEDEVTLVLGTATDELVTYKVKLSADRLEVTDPEGCQFSYQRHKPAE